MRLVGILLLGIVGLSGCLIAVIGAGVVLGAGIYSYTSNEYTQEYNAHIDRVFDAAMATVRELQFKVERHSKDALEGQIEAKRADNTPVRITVKSLGQSVTKLIIRVGDFAGEANKQAAETIRDKINQKVGK